MTISKGSLVNMQSIVITGLVGIPGGLIFHFLHVPLPWMLGPLTATLLYNTLSHGRACWTVLLRNAGMIVIGYSMGRTVTHETAQQVMSHLPGMVAVTMLTILFAGWMGYIICRRTGISLASAILGSIPGGMAQMVLLSEEVKDADVTVVTFMQVTRILAVLFIIPFMAIYGLDHPPVGTIPPPGKTILWDIRILPSILLAPLGAYLAHRVKLPVPFLLGPVFATAGSVFAGFSTPPVPAPLMSTAQLFFGIHMGTMVTLAGVRRLGKVLFYTFGSSLLLVAFTGLLAFGLTFVDPVSFLSAFLGTAPGGIAEMGVVTLVLGADVSFVLSYQLFRLFSILLAMPPLLKWRLRR